MPPQKNSGTKASKRVSGVEAKNSRFITAFMEDIRDGEVSDVYVSRVISRLGNGRMGIIYMDSQNQPHIVQAVIRGSFRGKGKRGVWIDIGSIVIISDSGVSGSAEFEIMAVLSPEEVSHIRKDLELDPRIFDINNTDPKLLMSDQPAPDEIVFEEEIDIEKI
jgi:hypothetical protein